MAVDNPSPRQSRALGYLQAAGILAASATAGPAAPIVASFLTEALGHDRGRNNDDWAAMTNARLASLEDHGVRVDATDPEFVAAVNRLQRASSETADREKRALLANVAAHSGSWSTVPYDRREEYVRLVSDLTPADLRVLAYFDDVATPDGIEATIDGDGTVEGARLYLSVQDRNLDLSIWCELVTGVPALDVYRMTRALESRGMMNPVSLPDLGRLGIRRRFTTEFGHEFLEFLRGTV